MQKLGVTVVPGSKAVLKDKEEAKKMAEEIGYPVMIKASAGGGGRGMRIVHHPEDLEKSFEIAKAEQKS